MERKKKTYEQLQGTVSWDTYSIIAETTVSGKIITTGPFRYELLRNKIDIC